MGVIIRAHPVCGELHIQRQPRGCNNIMNVAVDLILLLCVFVGVDGRHGGNLYFFKQR